MTIHTIHQIIGLLFIVGGMATLIWLTMKAKDKDRNDHDDTHYFI